MTILIWDPQRQDAPYRFIVSPYSADEVQSFLREVYQRGAVVAAAQAISFVDDGLREWLGDVVIPSLVYHLSSDEFVKRYEMLLRTCVARWIAVKKHHPDEDKYITLVKARLPDPIKKQLELCE